MNKPVVTFRMKPTRDGGFKSEHISGTFGNWEDCIFEYEYEAPDGSIVTTKRQTHFCKNASKGVVDHGIYDEHNEAARKIMGRWVP